MGTPTPEDATRPDGPRRGAGGLQQSAGARPTVLRSGRDGDIGWVAQVTSTAQVLQLQQVTRTCHRHEPQQSPQADQTCSTCVMCSAVKSRETVSFGRSGRQRVNRAPHVGAALRHLLRSRWGTFTVPTIKDGRPVRDQW